MEAQERIERYLSGNMSSIEQKVFEGEVKQNKALAEQVEFHRELMVFFEDYEPELEGILEGLGNQHFVAKPTSKVPAISNTGFNKLWFIPLGLLFALLIWFLLPNGEINPATEQQSTTTKEQSSNQTQIEDTSKEELPITIPETAPEIAPEVKDNSIPEKPENPTPPTRDIIIDDESINTEKGPIALVNPKVFEPNPVLESILQEQVRDEGFSTTITKPLLEQEFKAGNTIAFLLNGTTTAEPPYEFIIYSNRSNDFDNDYKTLAAILNSTKINDAYPFKFNANIPLESGLYYWILRQKESEEILHISKFLVR